MTVIDGELEAAVRKVLAEQAKLIVGADSADVDACLFDLGLDSQAVIRVMLGIEDDLDITFADDMLTRDTFFSIASIVSAVAKSRS